MPRPPRLIVPDQPHHVTHRGNYRQQIFFSEADRRLYLDLMHSAAERAQVRLGGYCLMPNHVHWIVTPETQAGLATLFRTAHSNYARYRHLLRRTAGHLWQARVYSSVLGMDHRWYALAYVERNPVRAGMVASAEQFVWSSAGAHLGVAPWPPWLDRAVWAQNYDAASWRRVLETSIGVEADERRLREATHSNAPYADRDALIAWSELAERNLLVRRARGRPKKAVPLVVEEPATAVGYTDRRNCSRGNRHESHHTNRIANRIGHDSDRANRIANVLNRSEAASPASRRRFP